MLAHIFYNKTKIDKLDGKFHLCKRVDNQYFMLAYIYEPVHEISNNVVCATSKASDQLAHKHSLIRTFACRSNIL